MAIVDTSSAALAFGTRSQARQLNDNLPAKMADNPVVIEMSALADAQSAETARYKERHGIENAAHFNRAVAAHPSRQNFVVRHSILR